MIIVFCIVALLVLCFAGVLLVGAPYLPTLSPQVHAALELANVKPHETLLELGCGDGKVLIAAAQVGAHAVGYELNPILALVAWLRTRKFGKQVRVIWGNFWTQDWPPAEVVFTFLLDRYMTKLDARISSASPKPVRLVSFAFQIPGKAADHEKAGVFLYNYPAKIN